MVASGLVTGCCVANTIFDDLPPGGLLGSRADPVGYSYESLVNGSPYRSGCAGATFSSFAVLVALGDGLGTTFEERVFWTLDGSTSPPPCNENHTYEVTFTTPPLGAIVNARVAGVDFPDGVNSGEFRLDIYFEGATPEVVGTVLAGTGVIRVVGHDPIPDAPLVAGEQILEFENHVIEAVSDSLEIELPNGCILLLATGTQVHLSGGGFDLLKTTVPQGLSTSCPPRAPGGMSEPQGRTPTVTVVPDGTTFTLTHDDATQTSGVRVQEGSVRLTPTNPSLPPLTLAAGQQVQVTPDGVSPVTSLAINCTPMTGTSGSAGKIRKLKVRCRNTSAESRTASITGVTPPSCALVKPASGAVKPDRRRALKVKVRCEGKGEFFAVTGEGLSE